MQSSWPLDITKAVNKYFLALDMGYPWEGENNYVTLAVFSPDFKEYNDHWKATFAIKIVVTSDEANDYKLDEVLGNVLVAMNEFTILGKCLKPLDGIETSKFEWDHSHQQATADATYCIELRG